MSQFRSPPKSKIIVFAMLLFCAGAIFATMLLTLIEGLIVHFGSELKPMQINFLTVVELISFMIGMLCLSIYLTQDAIYRVFIVRE